MASAADDDCAPVAGSTIAAGTYLKDVITKYQQRQAAFFDDMISKNIDRQDILHKIDTFIEGKEGRAESLLLVEGEVGHGKTFALASAVHQEACRNPSTDAATLRSSSRPLKTKVFYHFAKLVPRSVELDSLLRRLASALNILKDDMVPRDICTLAYLCRVTLASISCTPILIFIDDIDYITEIAEKQMPNWFPKSISPQVKFVLTATTNWSQRESFFSNSDLQFDRIDLTDLDLPIKSEIVRRELGEEVLSSNNEIEFLLIKSPSSNSLLWLRAACILLRLMSKENVVFTAQTVEKIPTDLVGLWGKILGQFETKLLKDYLIASLCLLTISSFGLLESELLDLLNTLPLLPLSPFHEKDENEISEKETFVDVCDSRLTSSQWSAIQDALGSVVHRVSDGDRTLLQLVHATLETAIKQRYFKSSSDEEEEISSFWHQKIANYLHHTQDWDRMFEECVGHLIHLQDKDGLADCFCNWQIFDRFCREDSNISQLLAAWTHAGGTDAMVPRYRQALFELEANSKDDCLTALRYEKISRLFLLAGKYSESLELAKIAMKLEEKELGKRPERMVEVYSLLTDIYDEKLKLQDFVSRSQIPILRKTINYGRKSIGLREQLAGGYHRMRLGMSLMKLAFSLESWSASGASSELTSSAAIAEGLKNADRAVEIFQELKDQGHYAEALMTKGVLSPRGTDDQIRYYMQALDICLEVYGEYSILTSRIYINVGIVHEDNHDFIKAYDYFLKWAHVNESVLGPEHPKTLRARCVLKEPRYHYIASRLKDLDDRIVDDLDQNNVVNEETINFEAQRLDSCTDVNSYGSGVSENDELQDEVEPDLVDVMRTAETMRSESNDLWRVAAELRRTIEQFVQHAWSDAADDASEAEPPISTADDDDTAEQQVQEPPNQSSSNLALLDNREIEYLELLEFLVDNRTSRGDDSCS